MELRQLCLEKWYYFAGADQKQNSVVNEDNSINDPGKPNQAFQQMIESYYEKNIGSHNTEDQNGADDPDY